MVDIVGPHTFQRRVRSSLDSLPSFVVKTARLARVEQSTREDVAAQIALYEHGTRVLYVSSGVSGSFMDKAVKHEVGHACDDNFGSEHFYSSSEVWRSIHRDQQYFDIPKYRDEPLEYWADMFAKYFVVGAEKLRVTRPKETHFVEVALAHMKEQGD